MRQIGVLPDPFQARSLADYLLTLRIDTRVEHAGEGYAVWVCDEGRVAQARQELDVFLKDPREPRYAAAAQTAKAIRAKEDEVEENYEQRQTELRELMAEPRKRQVGHPITLILIICAVFVAVTTNFVDDQSKPTAQALFITRFREVDDPAFGGQAIVWKGLDGIAHGELWRLVTPAFLHFNFAHLLLDVLMLYQMGVAVEERRGTWRFVLFFLVVASASNLAQYYLGWLSHFSQWGLEHHKPNPQFGGLSGVDYGLFGYIWMKSRYEPQLGFFVTPMLVYLIIGGFLLCFTGAMGPIANVAHAVGLGTGMLIGVAPTLWRKWRT